MHFKNGREAKAGDKVINLTYGFSGILHTVQSGSTSCNGRLAAISQNDPYVTVSECLHIDDVTAAEVPDSTKPVVSASAAVASAVAALLLLLSTFALFSGCSMVGKNATGPTGLEQKLFTVTTNYVPKVVTETNILTIVQTNTVQEVQTVIQTNQVGVPVVVPVTNYHTVTITNLIETPVTTTNIVAVPQLSPGTGSNTVTAVAGGVAGIFGFGGIVTTVLGGLLSTYLGMRNRAMAGQATALNQTAGALTQNIETLLNVLQGTPQGQAAMPAIKNYLMAHQTEAGVIQSVAGIIQEFVNEPVAKQSAGEILKAIGTIQTAKV